MTPRKQEKTFPVEYAAELMKIAVADFASAQTLALAFGKEGAGRAENILFLAQQALEKALKAVLCAKKQPVPLVHDVGILIAKLPENPPPPFGYELAQLNDFAAIRRYQTGPDRLTNEEITETLAKIRAALDWCKTQVR
jgi:HEPN domain-containing protein